MVSKKSAKKSAGKKSAKQAAAAAAPAAEAFEAHHLINLDLVKIWDGTEKGKKFVTVLGWGDEIVVLNEETMEADGHIKVRTTKFIAQSLGAEAAEPQVGYVVPKKGRKLSDVIVRKEQSRVLKVDFVDVQQGDGSVIITPNNRTILVDGGDNQMF